ncbi:MAG: hypothetical protein JEZ11_25695 [Desulfobacterales bacterium]|nr:hypothetical protein [Desulfobacterales bacterium]
MDRPAFVFSHRTNNFATHQPVLYSAVQRSKGPVAEFGCGYGSTPLLHKFCAEQGRPVVTFESNAEWIDKIRAEFASDTHWFIEVEDWETIVRHPIVQQTDWGLLFVDQAPFEARLWTVKALGDLPAYFVIHDCDYFPEHGLFGTAHRKLAGPHDTGIRTYDDVFSSYKEFFPLPPWPYAPTGPPTLLASNHFDCDIDIDFLAF